MLKPRALRPGARVAIVSPASGFREDELTHGARELQVLGFEAVVDPRIHERLAYVAGPAAVRAAVISDALSDPSIDALMGARGGYGSVQVLPWLDPRLVAAARKPVIGYSDLTSLLSFVTQQCGLVSFHGPMIAGRLSEGSGAYDPQSLSHLLTCTKPIGELRPQGLEILKPGEACGRLLGGTLTQLCASLGTPFAFDPPRNFVLLVDEVNERPYRLDRMMTQLRLTGILARAAAIIFNELPGCDEPGGSPSARETIAALLEDFGGPVLWGFPIGHTRGAAWTLPLGLPVRVIARPADSMVAIDEAAVENS
jgi:muramoyltetrapeptide carboxypeptidase